MTFRKTKAIMSEMRQFEVVHKNINKFETKLGHCVLPSWSKRLDDEGGQRFAAFAKRWITEAPKICTWAYMNETELEQLLSLGNNREVRKMIDRQTGAEYPKGLGRLLSVELIYSVLKFCKASNMNLRQTGTLLSIFYLTHQYFSSSFDATPQKVYNFFKEYILLHCINCPPDTVEMFNYAESKCVVSFFCTVYLRNLPLIKMLTLPNFGFTVQYQLPAEPVAQKGAKGKK